MWDYETCTLLVEQIGVNVRSVHLPLRLLPKPRRSCVAQGKTDPFPPRVWSLDWLTKHCQRRFGVTPQPRLLADKWGVSAAALAESGASKIVFTNGLNDGWSAGGITEDLSPTLLSVNMPQGAHHSDLSHQPAAPTDTADVTAARKKVADILGGWLREIGMH